MTSRILAVLSSLTVLACATAARAEIPRTMQLEYVLEPGAERCPAEQFFRDVVGARMRFQPFVAEASARLTVTAGYRSGRYHGRVELHDGVNVIWSNSDTPPLRDCQNVVHALGLIVANKLDPPGPRPNLSSPPLPPAAPPAAVLSSSLAPRMEDSARRVHDDLRIGLGAALALGTAPADAALDMAAEIGFCRQWLCPAAELRGSPPVADDESRSIASRVTGGVLACGRWRPRERWPAIALFWCPVLQAGAVFGTAFNVDEAFHVTLPYAALAGRLAVEVGLTRHWALRAATDLTFVLNGPGFRISGHPVWKAPPISGTAGGGVVALF